MTALFCTAQKESVPRTEIAHSSSTLLLFLARFCSLIALSLHSTFGIAIDFRLQSLRPLLRSSPGLFPLQRDSLLHVPVKCPKSDPSQLTS